MQYEDLNSCHTALTHVQTCDSVISKELVDAVFAYQKEILELRHKNAMHPKIQREKSSVELHNISLKQKRLRSMELIQELEVRVANAQAQNQADQTRLKELTELAFSLTRPCSLLGQNQPIPEDIILQCKQVIEAADAIH
jgi:hypothetical protein